MRRLIVTDRSIEGYITALAGVMTAGGVPHVRVRGWDEVTAGVIERMRAEWPDMVLDVEGDPEAAGSSGKVAGGVITLLFGATGEVLSPMMGALIDEDAATVIAPRTNHFHRNKVLFLVSIPKAGTHLLFELARALGFADGGECPPVPGGRQWAGKWYYLEYSNSHTAAPDFFIDTVRRRPFGNRDHPFTRNPTLFIYRNPMDIVASEADYYHGDGNTAFFQYLAHLNYEDRLLRLIDDPWLLGSIRDRVARFIAWTDFANVIPVSYEELVGEAGGGDRKTQLDLVWSLQLKLHVPGCPEDIARHLYNKNSPTFRRGRSGGGRERFSKAALELFDSLPRDFMEALGYGMPGVTIPARADEFRHRMPLYARSRFAEMPILEKGEVLGHNILRFRHEYYAVPLELGDVDITTMPQEAREALPRGHDLADLEHRLFLLAKSRNRS